MDSIQNELVYLDLLSDVLAYGSEKGDRTGTGTRSLFAVQNRYNLKEGFPLLTTKKMFTKGMIVELLWFIRGDTNIGYLHEHGVHFWDSWVREDGEFGPIYGRQLRDFNGQGVDQLSDVIHSIKNDPDSRRHIIALWNPAETDQMQLPPCHGNHIQFYVDNGELSCHMYQR